MFKLLSNLWLKFPRCWRYAYTVYSDDYREWDMVRHVHYLVMFGRVWRIWSYSVKVDWND